ncbi:MAG: hypothetical protein ACOYKQ_07945 [Polymorphobacter sp.]
MMVKRRKKLQIAKPRSTNRTRAMGNVPGHANSDAPSRGLAQHAGAADPAVVTGNIAPKNIKPGNMKPGNILAGNILAGIGAGTPPALPRFGAGSALAGLTGGGLAGA